MINENLFTLQIPITQNIQYRSARMAFKEWGAKTTNRPDTWKFPIRSWPYLLIWLRSNHLSGVATALEHSNSYRWAREEWERRYGDKYKLSNSLTCDFPCPMPKGYNLKPHQRVAVQYAMDVFCDGGKGVILGEDMGVGKTAEALGIVNEIRRRVGRELRVLVICPTTLKYNWAREAGCFSLLKAKPFLWSTKSLSKRNTPKKFPSFVIINYDIVKRYADTLIQGRWDVIICDEAHYIKNPQAARTKAVSDICAKAHFNLFLTGTPIKNRPIDLFPLLHILSPDQFKNYRGFAGRYCGGRETPFGYQANGATRTDELNFILRSQFMVRRTKDQVLPDLPEKQHQIIELAPEGYAAALKKERDTLSMYNLSAGVELLSEIKAIKLGGIAVGDIANIRHETALSKIGDVCSFADELLENQDKIIIFAHHRDVLEKIAEHYGDEAAMIYGGMSVEERDNSVTRFRTDPKVRVAVLSLVAASEGLTLVECHTVVFAELDWTPSSLEQAADRVHRIGQKHSVNIYYVVLYGSIDSYIAANVAGKKSVMNSVLNVKGE